MIDIVLMACLGIVGGTFTGLVPGVHPNTVAAILLTFTSSLLAFFTPHAVAVFIISMAISNTFLNFIPSVFIGAPEGDTALSVLPGHRFLLKGQAQEAICLTVAGGLGVMLLSFMMFPLVSVALPILYAGVKGYMAWLLLSIAGVMILLDDGFKRVYGLLVFGLSGMLGVMTMQTPLLPDQTMLFPIFTGLFGISTLIISLGSGIIVPHQNESPVRLDRRDTVLGSVKGFFSGMLMGVLPGIGAAQAGVLSQEISRGKSLKEFMVSLGGINTVAALFSLMALYLISKPRSGAAIAVQEVLINFGPGELALLMATALFSAGVAAFLTIRLGRWFAGMFRKLDYQKVSVSIIVMLIGMVAVMTGPIGMLYLATSTAIGLLPPLLGVKRTHCMGVLMLPIMLFYFGML
jgi:putative membrane protein